MTESEYILHQIFVLKQYLVMNLDRDDYHACWDAAVDLQRLKDKLDYIANKNK